MGDIFVFFMKHFIEDAMMTKHKPVLLLLGNNSRIFVRAVKVANK
jgi:hypothetical protein